MYALITKALASRAIRTVALQVAVGTVGRKLLGKKLDRQFTPRKPEAMPEQPDAAEVKAVHEDAVRQAQAIGELLIAISDKHEHNERKLGR